MSRFLCRTFFWSVLVAYLAGSAWWILHVPHRPDQLLRAIPGQASMISMHDALASRWDEVSGHAAVMGAVGLLGGDPETWAVTRSDPGLKTLVDVIGQEGLALAYVPFLSSDREGGWVFSSWIGGQSQRMRWSARYLDLPDLVYLGDVGGWPTWSWSGLAESKGPSLMLALVEGMLVGTLSSDPQAIEMVLDTYNGTFPSVLSRADLESVNSELLHGTKPDRLWYRKPAQPEPIYWRAALELAGANRLEGVVRGRVEKLPAPLKGPMHLEQLVGLWGQAPMAAAAMGTEDLRNWLMGQSDALMSAMLLDVLIKVEADAMALGLFGAEFSGRFKGMKVPSIMLALHLPTTADRESLSVVGGLLDRWNAVHRFGLVPVPEMIGNRPVWRIEGTAGGIYGDLAPPEQAALVVLENWLVISSHFKPLQALIEDGVGEEGETVTWAEGLEAISGEEGLGYLGFDLMRGTEAFRLAITAYTLKLMFEDAQGTRAQRKELNEAKAWLEFLSQMVHLHVFATAGEAEVKFDFHAGP